MRSRQQHMYAAAMHTPRVNCAQCAVGESTNACEPARDPPAVNKHVREACAQFSEDHRRPMTFTFDLLSCKLAHWLLLRSETFETILVFLSLLCF